MKSMKSNTSFHFCQSFFPILIPLYLCVVQLILTTWKIFNLACLPGTSSTRVWSICRGSNWRRWAAVTLLPRLQVLHLPVWWYGNVLHLAGMLAPICGLWLIILWPFISFFTIPKVWTTSYNFSEYCKGRTLETNLVDLSISRDFYISNLRLAIFSSKVGYIGEVSKARKPRGNVMWGIDYRCDDEKKNSWVGATSWYHCVAEDSRIPKMSFINPFQAIVHPQTQKKKSSCMNCQSQPQLLKFCLFWWIHLQIRNCDFNLPSN